MRTGGVSGKECPSAAPPALIGAGGDYRKENRYRLRERRISESPRAAPIESIPINPTSGTSLAVFGIFLALTGAGSAAGAGRARRRSGGGRRGHRCRGGRRRRAADHGLRLALGDDLGGVVRDDDRGEEVAGTQVAQRDLLAVPS